ncbi:MAG: exonuclease domain-containing protein [Reyranellaceae bacterium]
MGRPPPRDRTSRAGVLYPAGLLLAGTAIAAGLLWHSPYSNATLLAAAGLALGAILVWGRLTIVTARERQLRRLASTLEAAMDAHSISLPAIDRREADPLVARVHLAIAALLSRRGGDQQDQRRLEAILASLPQPLVVTNDQGLVTLVNRPAMEMFGADRLKPGTSVFDVVEAESLARRRRASLDASPAELPLQLIDGSTLNARVRELADHGGAVILFSRADVAGSGLAHALDLHEPTPPRQPPRPDTPLDALDVVVLDCETTGLNVALDRVVSIAGVRVRGLRLLRQETFDFLVDPGEPISAASTTIHGITNAMVWGEPALADRWSEIGPLLSDCVVVGHNVGFDLTILEMELRRAGVEWRRPPSLCTLQLAATLEPELPNLNLETLAAAYGIEVAGRHTALGDALVTAEVYLRLVALMRQRNETTLADAQARAATARAVIRQQQAAGW